MTKYGVIINPDFHPEKNELYNSITEYFNDPIMTKIKNQNKYSIYISKIKSLLGTAFRYIVVFIPQDINKNGFSCNLSKLDWISFQTRTLQDVHNLKTHSYDVINKGPLTQNIYLTERDTIKSTYKAENFPITITLLHTRKDNLYEYPQKGTIISALETYQTILSLN